MNPAELLNTLFQSIQSIGIFLVIAGVMIAFLWKVAFYVNLALGLIMTLTVTYLVSKVGCDIATTATFFLVGLVISLVLAAIGGVLFLIEGFTLSLLGFWTFLGLGSGAISQIFSSGTLIQSGIASAVSTGIAAYLGNHIFSLKLAKKRPSEPKESDPIEVTLLPEGSKTPIKVDRELPTQTEQESLFKKRFLGYIIIYKKVSLDKLAAKFEITRDQAEDILIEHVADGKIRGFIDRDTGEFAMEA